MNDLGYTVRLRERFLCWRWQVAEHPRNGTGVHLASGYRLTRRGALRAAVNAVQHSFADRNAAGDRVRPGPLEFDGDPLPLPELLDLADSLHPHRPPKGTP